MPETHLTAFAPAWPEGVTHRYLTVGGSTVDVLGGHPSHWACRACPGTSKGKYTGPFGDPFSAATIHEQAQAHAETCRAMPRPTA
ncbi:hypothetical protein [Streptomyces sp. NRRL F-2664]|uniref:hypothetical protein n=1 Tax=Streptomyces sp. NRRL F-2664 TaxID=1463842 RepID=UPI0004C9D7CD|nr:hypothetical protein [Streptomyces sp. NRRL F-2664]